MTKTAQVETTGENGAYGSSRVLGPAFPVCLVQIEERNAQEGAVVEGLGGPTKQVGGLVLLFVTPEDSQSAMACLVVGGSASEGGDN